MGSSPIPGWFVLRMENPWKIENNMDDLRVLQYSHWWLSFFTFLATSRLQHPFLCGSNVTVTDVCNGHIQRSRGHFSSGLLAKPTETKAILGWVGRDFPGASSSSGSSNLEEEKKTSVCKTIINHPIFYGLYHPSMVIWGMVYYCFNPLLYLSGGNPLLPPLSAIVSALGSCGNVGTKISVATALTISRWAMTRNAGNGT